MGALKTPRQEPIDADQSSDALLWPEAQRRRHTALQRALERLEDLRERMVAALDAVEGDPDLEPSLGSNVLMDQTRWAEGSPALMAYADLEDQCEGGGGDDACEDEGAQCEDEGGQCEGEGDDPYYMAPDDDDFLLEVTAEHRALQAASGGESLPTRRPS